MKVSTNILLIISMVCSFAGCKPDDVPPEPTKEGNPIVWKTALNSDDLTSSPLYYNGMVIFSQEDIARAFDATTGEMIWETPINARPIDFEGTFLLGDKVIFSEHRKVYVLCSATGEIIWQDELAQGQGGVCHIDGYIYKATYDFDRNKYSSLYRYDINTGIKEKVFTLTRGEFDQDHSPSLHMPVKWTSSVGDDLLVMQNRSFGWSSTMESKMDILAWNLTADSMEWYRNLDGFSSTARPAIDGDNVYFYGDHHAYCIDPATGETRWKYFIGDGPEDDFNTANIIIVKDKLIVKPDNSDIHAVDKETGKRIWFNAETEAMPFMLTERNDTIWFSSGGVWGVDANTGEKVIDDWKGSRSGSWIFPIAHHPSNGLIYTTDGDFLYCLNPKYMK
ncbi:MAG: PQQ-binding-like beta-propeller repeat protein [Bacteroidia bacterium]